MRILTKRLRLQSRGFHYKVALYLSYIRIKFDDEIKEKFFEFQAYFAICMRPKLNWRLSLATNERVINRSIRTTKVDLQVRRMFTDFLMHALSSNIYVVYE